MLQKSNMNRYLEKSYPNGYFTFEQILNDDILKNYIPKDYIPEIIVNEDHSIFIKPQCIIYKDNIPYSVKYVYITKSGIIRYNPDISYLQIGNRYNGFLMRLSVPKNNFIYHTLQLDYIIDFSMIYYDKDEEVYGGFDSNGNAIINPDSNQKIYFRNIDFSQYQLDNINEKINNFMKYQEELFYTYFQ